jgi:hypothetical protein
MPAVFLPYLNRSFHLKAFGCLKKCASHVLSVNEGLAGIAFNLLLVK